MCNFIAPNHIRNMRCFDAQGGAKVPLARVALIMIEDPEKRAQLSIEYCRMGSGADTRANQAAMAAKIMGSLDKESKRTVQNCYKIYTELMKKWPGKEMLDILTSALAYSACMCSAFRMRNFISESLIPAMTGMIKPPPRALSQSELEQRNKQIDTCLRLLSAVLIHASMLVPWKIPIIVLSADVLRPDLAQEATAMLADDAMPQASAAMILYSHLIGNDNDLHKILEKGAKTLVTELRKYRSYKLCGLCGSRAYKACGRCMEVRYCGPACQAAHYPMHKLDCHPNKHTHSGDE